MKRCFSRETLQDYQAGAASEDLATEIREHLQQCESCRLLNEELSQADSATSKETTSGKQPPAASQRGLKWLMDWVDSIVQKPTTDQLDRPEENSFASDDTIGTTRVPETSIRDFEPGKGAGQGRGAESEIPSHSSVGAGRFLPGQMLAGRYRIVSLLGRGGMGEVYRAEDIRLGQTVALKFLPHEKTNSQMLQYFLDEVRISQRLTHPHICRVHDLVEIGKHHCLSMEYIEGENLQELLRRIGKLTEAKTLELGHQICQGLAAAHDAGVLHRDLKPANIMIDERGRARITDFGLARETKSNQPIDGLAGTPAYMSPEQLSGNAIGVQSDIYALGLILYEMCTGKRAHQADTLTEIARLQKSEQTLQSLQTQTDVSAELESAIAACLAYKPAQRPGSAAVVAAMLPGTSPLKAMLAAGETPSPEMVAAAGPRGGLPVAWRVGMVATCLMLIAVAVGLSALAFSRLGDFRPPAALVDQASQFLDNVHAPRGDSRAWGYIPNRQALRWMGSRKKSIDETSDDALASETVAFWYRESPQPLAPLVTDWSGDTFLTVDEMRPVQIAPGSVHLRFNGEGNLRYLSISPAESSGAGGANSDSAGESSDATGDSQIEKDQLWKELFDQAGFTEDEVAGMESADVEFAPPFFADVRRSWQLKKCARFGGETIRIDAAATNGVPTYFHITGPWSTAPQSSGWQGFTSNNPRFALVLLIWIPLLIVFAGWLARRNLYASRADRAAATRLALFSAMLVMSMWLLGGGHVLASLELDLFVTALAGTTLCSLVLWCAYIAFEPYVRRLWPGTLISWNRLLQGKFQDPLVGRDLLVGIAAGALATIGKLIMVQGPTWFGWPSFGLPNIYNFAPLLGLRIAAGEVCEAVAQAIVYSLFFQLFFLLAIRLITRSTWLAAVAFVLFLSTMVSVQYQPKALAFLITAIEMTITVLLYLRVGLLAATTMHFTRLLLKWPSVSLDWHAESGQLAILILLAIVAFAAYTTRQRDGGDVRRLEESFPAPTW